MGNKKRRVRSIKQALVIFALLTALFVGVPYALELKSEQHLLKTHFVTSSGDTETFKLEIVNTPQGRAKGLMFVKEMDSDRGMLFIFPEPRVQSFYMKNTYIPLDMLFIDSEFKVVGILEDVPILNEKSRKVAKPSQYVIELNAGTAKKHGIKIGDSVVFAAKLPAAS
ncbi:MAG: DUF192 domain-containing protein [Deltaproteobacteria bacterium]|nr:DUF192 domain-containing protein [Deltaproteobacteria bacterium]